MTSRIPAEVLVALGLAISRPRGFMRPTVGPYSGAMADPVRPLVAIAGAEALAAAVLSVLVGLGARRTPTSTCWIAVATVVMWAVIVGALALIWFGLLRRRRVARTPFLLAQAFALVVAWPLVNSDIVVGQGGGYRPGDRRPSRDWCSGCGRRCARRSPDQSVRRLAQPVGSTRPLRSCASDLASSRETCICETPICSAIWAWVMFS